MATQLNEKELQPLYSEKEQEQLGAIREDAQHAADQKAQKWIELDDMDYNSWYEKAKKNSQAYIKPKENEGDVRVVTGTTREKGNTVVSTLLSYNLECDIVAYDENNNENVELGNSMEKMVRKSRELEVPRYEDKRPLAYTELVNQGNVWVRESWDQFLIPEKELEKMEFSEDVQLDKIKWKERIGKLYSFCNSKILTGLEVFPGNMRQPFMELQPFFIVRTVLSYPEAKGMFGKWERFKYVRKNLNTATELDHGVSYDDFQMIATEVDMMEMFEYYCKWTNTYQVLLNGVLMLPVGFPLSALIGICECPISKGDGEWISPNFFFTRGIGAKTRMDQAMLDEMFKMMFTKTRKSFEPPVSNQSNQNIGPSIYLPGKIFNGIDADKIKAIGDTSGVTVAEFNMVQFVKQIIDEKSISPIMEGQAPGRQATARQLIMQKEQSMTKLGGIMLGVLNLENRMAWLRIYNILRHWTDAIDQRITTLRSGVEQLADVYRTISVEDTFENGRKGEKIIDFTEDMPEEDSMVMAEEDLLSNIKRRPIRKVYINPKMLKNLKYTWQVIITPTEKNTDDLKAAMFEEFLQKIFTIFAPAGKMPNMDYLADRFAQVNDEDPNQIWQEEQPQQQPAQQPGMEEAMAGAQQPQGQIPAQMAPPGPNKPSLNMMLQ